jgi:hypothetical protein
MFPSINSTWSLELSTPVVTLFWYGSTVMRMRVGVKTLLTD